MGSGPRVGIGEIFLPELQKGSSIMPGKVNPVIPEVVLQVGAQVIGNDTAITIGGLQGQFELNVRIPLMARNLLQSIQLLSSASTLFAEKCVDGIEPNLPGLEALGRGHAGRRHGAEPVHRLRQGRGDRQGGLGLRRHAARGRAQARRRRGDAGQGARPAQDRGGFLCCLSSTASRRYYDAAPRSAARVEEVGPFTLFVGTGPWPYYARPAARRASTSSRAADVEAVRARQRELGQPEAFEWVHETTPSLLAAAREAGLEVLEAPLMVLERSALARRPSRRRAGAARARRRRPGARRRPRRAGRRLRRRRAPRAGPRGPGGARRGAIDAGAGLPARAAAPRG